MAEYFYGTKAKFVRTYTIINNLYRDSLTAKIDAAGFLYWRIRARMVMIAY